MTAINVLAAQRRRARHFLRPSALPVVYDWGKHRLRLRRNFRTDNDFSNVDTEYFNELLVGITQRAEALDELFVPHLDRELDVFGTASSVTCYASVLSNFWSALTCLQK